MNKQIYENICLIDNRKHQNNMHSHNWSNITAKKINDDGIRISVDTRSSLPIVIV